MRKIYIVIVIAGILFLFGGCQASSEKDKASTEIKKEASAADTCVVGMPSRSHVISLKKQVRQSADSSSRKGMVWIPKGEFRMGSEDFPDAQPVHLVEITNGFWMDETEVTNREFARFVEEADYVTIAERPLDPNDFPGVPEDKLVPGSAVFSPPSEPVSLNNPMQWWKYVEGASWKHPDGPQGEVQADPDKPVVHVSFEDTKTYCEWAGKRLPTEAEWEYAARGGEQHDEFYWGDSLKENGKWPANIHQGEFPHYDAAEDGFAGVAPVKSYPPNPYGLYDMEGNVWEWTQDYYRPDHFDQSHARDPKGPSESYDPMEPHAVKYVQKGGSFLCSDQYCMRYRAGSRGNGEVSSGSNNLGFRCVADG